MKKVSITILLLLPIVLIYFISFLGRIASVYIGVAAESIEVSIAGEVISDQQNILYNLDEFDYSQPIKVVIDVLPEFASNKKYTITNSDPTASDIVANEENETFLMLYKPGISYYAIESDDSKSVNFHFSVKSIKGELKEILVFDENKSKTDYITEISVPIGKTKTVGLDYLPLSTLEVYKGCTWVIDNPTIAKLDNSKTSATITGLIEGETFITITSIEKPEISTTLKIIVKATSDEDAYFNFFKIGYAFVVYENTFDFKMEGGVIDEGKIVINDSSLTYDDIILECTAGSESIDPSTLGDKILTFKNSDVVEISMHRMKEGKKLFLDKMHVLYIEE